MEHALTFGVIGKTGQLACALKKALASMPHQGIFLGREHCDLSQDAGKIEAAIEAFSSVDAIIIAAAYTQVDLAEDEEDLAMAVNAIAPGIIAAWAAEKHIPLIYISTDYVFNGKAAAAYTPYIPTDPINSYGRSKSLGEQVVRAAQPHSAILRTSWLYDGVGQNFLVKMLGLAQNHESLAVVNDQTGRPTYAGHLAQAVLAFAQGLAQMDKAFSGTFHISDSGPLTSWAGFAREIFTVFEDVLPHKVTVKEVSSSTFPSPANRPASSVLDLTETEEILEHSLPDWREGVKVAKRERQNHMQDIAHE